MNRREMLKAGVEGIARRQVCRENGGRTRGLLSFLAVVAAALTVGSPGAAIADWDHDGIPDFVAICKAGASNTTEVHILSGSSNFQKFFCFRELILYFLEMLNNFT